MSKLFWGVLTFFSLIITAWAGFFVYNEFQTKDLTNVPLTPVVEKPTPAPVDVSTTTAAATISTATATQEMVSTPTETSKPKIVKGKEVVDFKFTSEKAKKVSLVGEFNKWYRQPMKREGNTWSVSVPIAPGKYQYVFVVDDGQNGPNGKRVLDPHNEQKSKDGKLSIITIKPIPKDK
jgi:hypothetical protein